MRTLSQRELNRALLARQGLLERRELSLPAALDAMGALQAQYAPSMYVGLWSRVAGFERDALTRALERREVVQATLLRSTIHLVSRADYWPLARRDPRCAAARGCARPSARTCSEEAEHAAARRCARGPMKRKAIEELIGKEAFNGIGLWVDMVRVPPSGTWERRRADLFGLAEDWVGAPEVVERPARPPRPPLPHGLRAGLEGRDRQLGGLVARDVEPALERLELVRLEAEDGTELLRSARSAAARTRTRRRPCASSAPGTPSCSCTRGAR